MTLRSQSVVVMFDGGKGKCNACKTDLTSDQHNQKHVGGRKHRYTVDRINKNNDVACCPIEWEICHKPFSSVENATQHFSYGKNISRS